MSVNFEGKVIALTGGASGIGLATSKLLASRGATVCIGDVQASALESVVKDITSAGGTAFSTILNVTDRGAVTAWIDSIVSTHGRLDGAANLAGVIGKTIGVSNLEEIEDEEWNFILDINMKGVFYCLGAELRAMTKLGKGGSIVNAASVAGIIGLKKNAAYAASKHAVVGLTRAAAKEAGERKIRVNAIAPGPIDTPMTARLETNDADKTALLGVIPLGRSGQASEVAELICWLLCDASAYITGTIQRIDGGWAD